MEETNPNFRGLGYRTALEACPACGSKIGERPVVQLICPLPRCQHEWGDDHQHLTTVCTECCVARDVERPDITIYPPDCDGLEEFARQMMAADAERQAREKQGKQAAAHLGNLLDDLADFIELRIGRNEYPAGDCEHLADVLLEIADARRTVTEAQPQ